jgi:indole-3-glycerol phosphate synthase
LVKTVPDILARIVAQKRRELARTSSRRAALERQAAATRSGRRDFREALASRCPAIIAEIKKASPSRGVLTTDFDPVRLAAEYECGGAVALSVLTDGTFFQGSLADLAAARAAVKLPVLRKDFTLDAVHVIEAAAHGADAVLLIAAVLDETQIRELRELAARYELASVVEVHDRPELDRALSAGAEIIGVNNRNLSTFEVTIETSLRLAEHMPDGVIKISESGIQSRQDIRRLQQSGYSAFLIGEHLMKAGNPAKALRELSRDRHSCLSNPERRPS